MSSHLLSTMQLRAGLQHSFDQIFESWRLECNAKGEEIYYDMSKPKKRGMDSETIEVGQYKTRPCPNHRKGHQCNPPAFPKLRGF